ncbi:FG-GAP-like repeat-containing protein [Lysobacter capsici]|uniref:FG-GAP-like repeat-containing protein n=1 Tax=Lysobacter capsici TaxID=435897 RepID=UPI00287B60C9|nr:FG-GAP-like repeat-containing protein [Lysobacter capsici]WND79644.1 FG-GAP-like repeat-containing protein [Lysobacter capsici]WND84840.1 FG-GAP-like repeat-containing protein [Lysobacter capsici]
MTDTAATTYRFVDKLIDSSDDNNHYAYAPSIVVENGVFHMFYCSFGNGGWDDVRYSTSPDGRRWSAPVVVLTTTDSVNERATCDPSVVKYQAPGDSQPYYYLFYSGNKLHTQTVMFVARATNVGGPYSKWTTDHTWVPNAPNPKIIIGPAVPKPDASGWYGAGQQSVVVRNGQLVSWYTDDTTCANAPCNRLFTSTTTNPTAWPAGTQIDVQGQRSVDVKYDPQLDKYVMFYIGNEHDQTSYLVRRYSQNGVNWDQPETLCDTACFPDWTHNPGVSGTVAGQLIDGRALVAYGAPYDLHPSYDNGDCAVSAHSPYCWGRWDLYGSVINPKGEVWNAIPWGWQWNAMSTNRDLALGDYDGDGKTDRAIVDRANSSWYVIASSGSSPIAWGWQWNAMSTNRDLALGDYDGDGKTDRAIVDRANSSWYVIASSGSSPIAWGWQWSGMGSQHELVLGDYDGDGKTDRAIVDRSTSAWYVIASSGTSPIAWGWQWAGMDAQEELALGDYDGDGKTDRAIVDRATSRWYVISSSGQTVVPWGWQWNQMDTAAPLALGDYDGDGKIDRTLANPANSSWYTIASSGVDPFPWGWHWDGYGSQHDLALGDYDGDGKTDRAIVDRILSSWYVISSSGQQIVPWGWQWPQMSADAELALGDYDGDGKTDRAIVDTQSGRWYVITSAPFEIY